MADVFPIKFKGGNLGQRHKYLNNLVNDAYINNVPFHSVINEPEQSDVDRFFKIDLANKYRNVDYIIDNLRCEEMLYVSRALKCTWLITDEQYQYIIHPQYLEEKLFLEMLTTAVTKMKSCIKVNLKDEKRCEVFYEYYKEDNFAFVKCFLPKCSPEWILKELENVKQYMTPHYLKLLAEKCPEAADSYYKSLPKNKKNLSSYSIQDKKYFDKMKFLLKIKPDLFFYLLENFYNRNKFKNLSSNLTKYIMNNYKQKVLQKPELYITWVLHLSTVAKYLNPEEVKEIVVKLARAQYLGSWFNYKNVEPLLKRLGKNELSAFKKYIFIQKSFGEMQCQPPYTLPIPPKGDFDRHILSSADDDNNYDETGILFRTRKRKLIKKKCHRFNRQNKQTLLEQLFDAYRHVNFSKTFYELKKRLLTESSPNNRMMIMNVLVSKSAGREEQVLALMEHLARRHCNEPSNVRAAVVRSLVRRARVYSLSDECWRSLTIFAYGLTPSDCSQYTHASFIRNVLQHRDSSDALSKDFMEQFDTLSEYDLTPVERDNVLQHITTLLFDNFYNCIREYNLNGAADLLWKLLNTIRANKIVVKNCAGFLSSIGTLSKMNLNIAESIMAELYRERSCRKIFFREYFAMIQNEDSYLNALRHDESVLTESNHFKKLISKGELKHGRFLLKLSTYFKDDLAKQYLTVLEETINSGYSGKCVPQLCRSMCILSRNEIFTIIETIKSHHSHSKKLEKCFRHNLHKIRPAINLNTKDWKEIGVIVFGTLMRVASRVTVKNRFNTLASIDNRGFRKLALELSFRVLDPPELAAALSNVGKHHTVSAIHHGLLYLQREGDRCQPIVWEQIRKLMLQVNLKNNKTIKDKYINNIEKMPSFLRIDYCLIVYKALNESGFKVELPPILSYLNNNLDKCEHEIVSEILVNFLRDDFIEANITYDQYIIDQYIQRHVKMISRFLLLNKTEKQRDDKFKQFGGPFLTKVAKMMNESKVTRGTLFYYFHQFCSCLNYRKVFLDPTYVSVLPTLQKISRRMQQFLPVEQYFNMYSRIHITMVYFKSVRQSIRQKPEIFADRTARRIEGVKIIGIIFGKYMAIEMKELVSTYFISIRELYYEDFISYWRIYLHMGDSPILLMSFVKSLLETGNTDAALLANYIIRNELEKRCNDKERTEILDILKKVDIREVKFFLNST